MITKHYIDKNGQVYGYRPEGIEVREMTDAEFQAYKIEQETPTPEQILADAKSKRDALLADTDWYVVRQAETGKPVPTDVLAYRQELRDIDQQPGWPTEVNWPTLPSA